MKKIIIISFTLSIAILQSCSKEKGTKLLDVYPNFEGTWDDEETWYQISSTTKSFSIFSNSEGRDESSLQEPATIEGNVITIGDKKYSIDEYPSNFHLNYWDMVIDGKRYVAGKIETSTPECSEVQIAITNSSSSNIMGCLDCSSSAPRDTILPGQILYYPASFSSISTWGSYSIGTIDCVTSKIIP
jgi:hypothetical protein